jgi:hypothetical protein
MIPKKIIFIALCLIDATTVKLISKKISPNKKKKCPLALISPPS